ncbi:redoxin domain-containing protein [Cecembia rubra]|uniref:AhpC/TSA family protein n=1 Tax=Cecembia rubra TaxID=1485585 RepID=A0A2P8DYM5_9BACT|nr:redoxin domain-containing protein [Cecembia rubra]PSL02319.1 AhpC/TSA family protein [Cecembia rubra]
MKKLLILSFSMLVLIPYTVSAQRVDNFQLPDVLSGGTFSLTEHNDAKGVVLIFTSLNCPFSKLYEERIVNLHTEFNPQGFVFALVNPHVKLEEGESADEMKKRAEERGIMFSFLADEDQVVTRQLGITKLPEVVLVTPSPTGYSIAYRGAIDNNPQVAANANLRYLESAMTAIANRRNPSPASSRPVGCNIRLLDF